MESEDSVPSVRCWMWQTLRLCYDSMYIRDCWVFVHESVQSVRHWMWLTFSPFYDSMNIRDSWIFIHDQSPLLLCPVLCGCALAYYFSDPSLPLKDNVSFKISSSAVVLIFYFLYCGMYHFAFGRNDDGADVKLGGLFESGSIRIWGGHQYYCGRVIPIPGADGQCGPDAGNQCPSCACYQRKVKAVYVWPELQRLLRIGRWLCPALTLMIFFLLFASPEEDIHCGPSAWGPMIPWIASIYLPAMGSQRDQSIKNVLVKTSAFTPFVEPQILLPKMNQPITDKTERDFYFGIEIIGTIAVTGSLLEVVRWLCKKKTNTGLGDASHETPLIVNDALQITTNSSARLPATSSAQSEHATKTILYRAGFIVYYIAYQLFLYVLLDFGVARGFINLRTGIAWEFWVIFVQFVCISAFFTGVPWLIWNYGISWEHPAPLLCMQLTPWLGNELHIMKDHVAQALCFAVAHCQSGALRAMALLLGYLSIASSFLPLCVLFADDKMFKSLRIGHWPIPESNHKQQAVKKTGAARVYSYIHEIAVAACMPDKYTRALVCETPHAILHVNFAYFFGGSRFIVYAIVLSAVKIFGIPLARMTLQSTIARFGCSETTLQRYFTFANRLDWDSTEQALAKAFEYGWEEVLDLLRNFASDIDILFGQSQNEGSDTEDNEKLRRLLQSVISHAGSDNEKVEKYILFLRILRSSLGICDRRLAIESFDMILSCELPRECIEYLPEIEKMGRQTCLLHYMEESELFDPELPDAMQSIVRSVQLKFGAQVGDPDIASDIDAEVEDGPNEQLQTLRKAREEKVWQCMLFLALFIPMCLLIFLRVLIKS